MTTITVWNGKENRQVRTFRSAGNLHLIKEGGQYAVIRQMFDNRIIYLTSYTNWRRADFDNCFDRHAASDQLTPAPADTH